MTSQGPFKPKALYDSFGNGFQDSFFHHLPRDQGEADRPIDPQILFITLPEGRREFSQSS